MKLGLLNLKITAKLLVVLSGAVILVGLVSCNKNSDIKSPEQLKSELVKEIPGIGKIDAVNSSPISGIYEVVVGRKIFYASNDGKYLMFGNLIDPVSKKNITEERTIELGRIDWNKLPLDLAIKEVNGTGERKVAVFSDPDCPYCQMFEKQVVPSLTNTTVYVFLFPLPMHHNARADSEAIWCSKDRAATWIDWMRNKTPLSLIGGKGCDTTPLDKVYKVGTDLVQVEGTPTLVLSNGQIIPGAMPADQLIQRMDEARGILSKNTAASSVK